MVGALPENFVQLLTGRNAATASSLHTQVASEPGGALQWAPEGGWSQVFKTLLGWL